MKDTSKYPRINPTVDVAILNPDFSCVLLGRKKHQEKFRFIGGFVEIQDNSYEETAVRECGEEANVKIISLHNIFSTTVLDPRFDNITEGIKTTFYLGFACNYYDAQPGDDIVQLKEFRLNELTLEDFVEEHKPLAQLFFLHISSTLKIKTCLTP